MTRPQLFATSTLNSLGTLVPTAHCGFGCSQCHIPPELTDSIIDYLHADDETLQACCLTCKTWLPSARHHLFSKIILTPELAERALRVPPLIATAQHLVIERLDCKDPEEGAEYQRHMPGAFITETAVSSLTDHSLNQSESASPNATIGVWGRVALSFVQVHHLEFLHVDAIKLAELTFLVRCFPFLEVLTIRDFRSTASGSFTEFLPRRLSIYDDKPLQLYLFQITDGCAVAVKDWILANQPQFFLKALEFDIHKFTSYHAMRDLIKACGPSIHELTYHLTFAQTIEEHAIDFVDLSSCKELRRLHVDSILLIPRFSMTVRSTPWIPVLCSQLAESRLVEDITFTILLHGASGMDCIEWKLLDGLSMDFPSLKAVHVRFAEIDDVEPGEVAHMLRTQFLPNLHRENLLSIDFLLNCAVVS